MKERIIELIKALKEDKKDFYEIIGVSKDTVRMYIDRGSKPKSDFMEKVFRSIENLNPEWWLTGEGEIFKKDKELSQADTHPHFDHLHAIPLYDIEINAGNITRLIDLNNEVAVVGWHYLKDNPNTAGVIGVKAVGNSMAPFINNGDTMLIRRIESRTFVNYGDAHVIIGKEQSVVKYVRPGSKENRWLLKSHNHTEHDDYEIDISEVVHLFVVVKVLKDLSH